MAFKVTDYILTPMDLYHGIRALLKLSLMGWVRLILVVGAYFVARHYGASIIDAGFITFLVVTFTYDIEARIPLSLALGALILIVLILTLGPHTEFINETTWPEPIAVWVYYFLAIGVLKQMKDVLGGERGKELLNAVMHPREIPVARLKMESTIIPVKLERHSHIYETYGGRYTVEKIGTIVRVREKGKRYP